MAFFSQVFINGISLGVLYAIAAIGFVMIYRTSHVLNFAHGGLMAMGAFVFLALSSWGRLPIIFTLLLLLVVAFAIGLFMEKGFHRTLGGSNPLHGAILTIGLALIFKSIFTFLSGIDPQNDPAHLFEVFFVKCQSLPISASSAAIFLFGAAFFVLFGLFMKYTSLGIYVRSTTENRSAALALGVPVKRVLALSWAIAAMFCAVTGAVLGMVNPASPQELGVMGLKVFPVVVLGGLNSIGGAILGGILIGALEALARGYISVSFGDIVPYMILFLVIVWKPGGLFGTREMKRSW